VPSVKCPKPDSQLHLYGNLLQSPEIISHLGANVTAVRQSDVQQILRVLDASEFEKRQQIAVHLVARLILCQKQHSTLLHSFPTQLRFCGDHERLQSVCRHPGAALPCLTPYFNHVIINNNNNNNKLIYIAP